MSPFQIACDNTEKNKRLIHGEWVVHSLSEYPLTIVPHAGKLDRESRVMFDTRGLVGIFSTDTTRNRNVFYYSISDDRLTIWISDYGIDYEIQKLSRETLTLVRSFAGETDEESATITMIKAQ